MENIIKFFTSLFNQKEEKAKAEVSRKEQEEKKQAEHARKKQKEKRKSEGARKEQENVKADKKLKFKVGDRVRVIKHGIETGHTFIAGRVVTITSVYENEGRYYAENDRGGHSYISDDYIEELN